MTSAPEHVLALIASISVLTVVIAFEMQNLASRWHGRVLTLTDEASDDFTVIVPLYGHPRYFDDRERLLHLQRNVLVSMHIDSALISDFADQLEREGWRVFRTVIDDPAPQTLFEAALMSDAITTSYVARLDADTVVHEGDMPRAVAAAQADGADICSVKVRVLDPRTLPERMQELEYDMAMLSRHYRPWLTSGACHIATTEAARAILSTHTRWTVGEDTETGRIAHSMRMRVRHAGIVVETRAPDTWRGLFTQRRLWWAGSFRHNIANLDFNALHMPIWSFYYVVLAWGSVLFGLWHLPSRETVITTLVLFPVLYVVYLVILLLANFQVRSRYMLLMPLYGMVQSFLMAVCSPFDYVRHAREHGNLGRYRFPWRRTRWSARVAGEVG